MFEYVVKTEESGLQLKTIVKNHFEFSSRLMTKLKQQNLVFLNGEAMPGWVQVFDGDVVTIKLPDESSDFPPEDIPLDIVYEDSDILVINKQPQLVVHPTKGKPYHTLANGVMKYMLDKGENYKIRFVNRLDMNTSGLVIVAKNSHSQDTLAKGEIKKKYVALVDGILDEKVGTIDLPLGRPDPNEVERWVMADGFPSKTHYKVLEEFGDIYSLLELELETGRTHQIRVHLSYSGHPIVGDHLYCNGDPFEYRRIHGDPRPPLTGEKGPRMETNPEVVSDLIDRQALHAYSLTFKHPISGEEIKLEVPIPEDMKRAIEMAKEKA